MFQFRDAQGQTATIKGDVLSIALNSFAADPRTQRLSGLIGVYEVRPVILGFSKFAATKYEDVAYYGVVVWEDVLAEDLSGMVKKLKFTPFKV